MSFVVKSAVKEYAAVHQMRVSADFVEALETEIQMHIDRAIQRAKDNARTTLQKKDM